MNTLECIENELLQTDAHRWILGCDEVGRGPLAGPVTAACVAFPIDLDAQTPLFALLNDSKKLTAKTREALVPQIEQTAAAYAIVDLPPEEIDRINILMASLTAMRMAVGEVVKRLSEKKLIVTRAGGIQKSLFSSPNADALAKANVFVAVDGNKRIPELVYPQEAFVKGDARSWNIAAASIIAKVHRDQLMAEYDKIYPGYGFAKHAGYPTQAHRDAIHELGFCPIHRRSFKVK